MMHEDDFPGFMKLYRELRGEGIVFPERNPNERMMMDGLKGIDSPMFEFVE